MSWNRIGIYHCEGRKLPWTVRWYGNPGTGTPRRYCKSFATKTEADTFKAEKQQEIRKTGRRDPITGDGLKRLCDDFLASKGGNVRPATKELYELTVNRLISYFGADRSVNSIKAKEADLFLAAQVLHQNGKRTLTAWTKAQMVTHCRTIFDTAIRWGLATENPFKHADKPKCTVGRWHHVKLAEYKKLLEAAPDLRWRCLYALLYTAGLRFGEAVNLTWADIDVERAEVKIDNRHGTRTLPAFFVKDHEKRVIPLPKQTVDLLVDYQQTQAPEGVPYILLSKERYQRILKRWHKMGQVDSKWRNRHMANNVLRTFKVHARRAEIRPDGKLTLHVLRKSFAQNLANGGTPVKTLQYLMGHSSEKTTLTFYAQLPTDYAELTRQTMERLLDPAKSEQIDAGLDAQPVPPESEGQEGDRKSP
jgi:integrase